MFPPFNAGGVERANNEELLPDPPLGDKFHLQDIAIDDECQPELRLRAFANESPRYCFSFHLKLTGANVEGHGRRNTEGESCGYRLIAVHRRKFLEWENRRRQRMYERGARKLKELRDNELFQSIATNLRKNGVAKVNCQRWELQYVGWMFFVSTEDISDDFFDHLAEATLAEPVRAPDQHQPRQQQQLDQLFLVRDEAMDGAERLDHTQYLAIEPIRRDQLNSTIFGEVENPMGDVFGQRPVDDFFQDWPRPRGLDYMLAGEGRAATAEDIAKTEETTLNDRNPSALGVFQTRLNDVIPLNPGSWNARALRYALFIRDIVMELDIHAVIRHPYLENTSFRRVRYMDRRKAWSCFANFLSGDILDMQENLPGHAERLRFFRGEEPFNYSVNDLKWEWKRRRSYCVRVVYRRDNATTTCVKFFAIGELLLESINSEEERRRVLEDPGSQWQLWLQNENGIVAEQPMILQNTYMEPELVVNFHNEVYENEKNVIKNDSQYKKRRMDAIESNATDHNRVQIDLIPGPPVPPEFEEPIQAPRPRVVEQLISNGEGLVAGVYGSAYLSLETEEEGRRALLRFKESDSAQMILGAGGIAVNEDEAKECELALQWHVKAFMHFGKDRSNYFWDDESLVMNLIGREFGQSLFYGIVPWVNSHGESSLLNLFVCNCPPDGTHEDGYLNIGRFAVVMCPDCYKRAEVHDCYPSIYDRANTFQKKNIPFLLLLVQPPGSYYQSYPVIGFIGCSPKPRRYGLWQYEENSSVQQDALSGLFRKPLELEDEETNCLYLSNQWLGTPEFKPYVSSDVVRPANEWPLQSIDKSVGQLWRDGQRFAYQAIHSAAQYLDLRQPTDQVGEEYITK